MPGEMPGYFGVAYPLDANPEGHQPGPPSPDTPTGPPGPHTTDYRYIARSFGALVPPGAVIAHSAMDFGHAFVAYSNPALALSMFFTVVTREATDAIRRPCRDFHD